MSGDGQKTPYLMAVAILSLFVIGGVYGVYRVPFPPADSSGGRALKEGAQVSGPGFLATPAAYLQELGDLEVLAKFWPKLPKPGPDDWLAHFPEAPQTIADLLKVAPERARNQDYGIVVQPVLPIWARTRETLDTSLPFLKATYQCPVRMNEKIHAPKNVYFRNEKQINASLLLDRLLSSRPSDAWSFAAVTSFDLGQEGLNFVFGLSSPDTGVNLSSDAQKTAPDFPMATRRMMSTLIHESGHALGLTHCIGYRCIMNGSNHLDEADARPTMMCPHCLAKLRALRGIDPVRMFHDLAALYEKAGLEEDMKLARQAEAALSAKSAMTK